MIHGLLGGGVYLEPAFAAPALAGRGLCVPDLPGFGESATDGPADVRMPGQARVLAALLDHLADQLSEPVTVFGHSMGGVIAVLLAALCPKRIGRVVLAEPNLTEADAFWTPQIIDAGVRGYGERMRELHADPSEFIRMFDMDDTEENRRWLRRLIARTPPETVYHAAVSLLEETKDPAFLRRVIDLPQPVHFIVGERTGAREHIPSVLPEDKYPRHDIPDAGHFMMLDNPAAFYACLAQIA
jgi:pimeloyl-ACP methyl ester carboxylesterase